MWPMPKRGRGSSFVAEVLSGDVVVKAMCGGFLSGYVLGMLNNPWLELFIPLLAFVSYSDRRLSGFDRLDARTVAATTSERAARKSASDKGPGIWL